MLVAWSVSECFVFTVCLTDRQSCKRREFNVEVRLKAFALKEIASVLKLVSE